MASVTVKRIYGPPKIAADTALRLTLAERVLVNRTYTVRPDPALPSSRQFRCRWCGQAPFMIQTTDATRHSARVLVAHAQVHQKPSAIPPPPTA